MGLRIAKSVLERTSPFASKLIELERRACEALGARESLRLATALYDPADDSLHTFSDSGDGAAEFTHYSAHLAEIPSLAFAREVDAVRVVDDLKIFEASRHKHTLRLLALGFRSSYARAVHYGSRLIGIVFLNSRETGFFNTARVAAVAPFVQMTALHLALELSYYQTFSAAITSAQAISAYRDTDTADHLTRMSHFSALIADALAGEFSLSDDFVAKLFQFAPMHDIGKVGVPDSILLKPGKLTPAEFEAMKAHVRLGEEMVDKIVDSLNIGDLPGLSILRNIVACHHERMDGSGYPRGISGTDIPIEAQILAVADVFDALTSRRPYKEPWPVEQAIDELRKMAPSKLNPACVEALARSQTKTLEILDKFKDGVAH
ncbi:MAG: HD domain-containing protein [Alphaproteobacteria bacterium]|nr:HD domain-containing protein [Alphaproteobacteria bacterium]